MKKTDINLVSFIAQIYNALQGKGKSDFWHLGGA